jgi:hypothetical protein
MHHEQTTAPPEASPPEETPPPAPQTPPDLAPAQQIGVLLQLLPMILHDGRTARKVGRFLRTLQRRELLAEAKRARRR